MAVTFDAAASAQSLTQPSSLTWSHTCTGSNLYLFVTVGMSSGTIGNVTGITYNGVAMTSLWNVATAFGRGTGWGLKAPATGAHNVVASFSGANDEIAGLSVSYTGVDQTTPTGTVNSASSSSGTTSTVDITSASGELVVDGSFTIDASQTIGAGQTQRATQNPGQSSTYTSEEAGAATVTMSWTHVDAEWVIGGVPLKPVAASGPIPPGSAVTERKGTDRRRQFPVNLRTWTWQYNQNLIAQDVLPPGRKGITFDLAPKGPRPAGPTWTSRYNDNLIGKDVFPPGRQTLIYEEVQPILWRRDWTLNLLQTTLAPAIATMPFRQRDWPLPGRAAQPDRTWISTAAELQLRLPPPGDIWTDLPPAPFFWRNGSALNLLLTTLVAQDSFPPGVKRTERPPPLDWRTGFSLNLLQSTLIPSEAAPFAQYDWPLPRVASQPDRTWTAFFNPNLVGQDAFPPGVVRAERPPPIDWRREWTLNLVLSTLVGQDEFPPGAIRYERPPPIAWKNGFELNLVLSVLAAVVELPRNQYDWPLPGQGWQPPRTWTSFYNINLIGQDQFPTRQMDWPLPTGYFYPASVRVAVPLNPNLFPPPAPPVVTQEFRSVKVAGGEFGFMGLRGGVVG